MICWTLTTTDDTEHENATQTGAEPDRRAAIAAAAAAAREAIATIPADTPKITRYTLTIDGHMLTVLAVTPTANGPDTGPALDALDSLTATAA